MSEAAGAFARLGLAQARIPHVDRHGLLWLSWGRLAVEDGTLQFTAAKSELLDAGVYAIPYQTLSILLLGPGTSVTHDVFRLLGRHGVLLLAVGDGGVKCYTAPPFGQGQSEIARRHAQLCAQPDRRLGVARKMYAIRFGEVLPHRDISVLRGIEGSRMKESYRLVAERFGIEWHGRRYDRAAPTSADLPNQAINHASTFVEAAAETAVSAVGALPPLGFIHEDSSNAFTLDVADLCRVDLTLPLAFAAVRESKRSAEPIERSVRRLAVAAFRKESLVPKMIDRIKDLVHVDDGDSHS